MLAIFLAACSTTRHTEMDTVVKVELSTGHGSGVHIGNGNFLTARHVVGDVTDFKIRFKSGRVIDAHTVWVSKEYDIALIKAEYTGPKSDLSCRKLRVGENVIAMGNPTMTDFVTSWGKLSGESRQFGPWKSAYVVQIPIAPGSSGGPLFDEQGRVVGINVGVSIFKVGFGGSATGLALTVPSYDICNLLAR